MTTQTATTTKTRRDAFLEHAVICIDSREQKPYCFGEKVRTETKALATGDYSLLGHEHSIAIERKSLSDLRHCVGGDRARFERELERLAAMQYGCLAIEGTLDDLRRPGRFQVPGKRVISPSSVLGSLSAWSVKYRLPVWFCGSWLHGREVTFRLLRHFWRYNDSSSPDFLQAESMEVPDA